MENQNVFGAINTLFVFVSLLGVLSQWKTIQRSKQKSVLAGDATRLLSLNQFSVSFLAYLSFFVYGYSIQPVNDFLIWPRLVGCMIVGMILYEIWRDRKNRLSAACFTVAIVCLSLAFVGFVFQKTSGYSTSIADESRLISTSLIVLITLFLAQGYYHQISLIIRAGTTGAVDLKMSQFILLMDMSTVAFALSLGLGKGWPLLFLAVVSATTKLTIMYLFYWVRTSHAALQKRQRFEVRQQ